MSSYMGLNPSHTSTLSQTMRLAITQVDDVSAILTQASTTSDLPVSLAPLWELQQHLLPAANQIDFAAGLMIKPISMNWQKPTVITGTRPWWQIVAQAAQCPPAGGDTGGYLTQRPLGPLMIDEHGAAGARSLAAAIFGSFHGPNAVAPDEFGVVKLDARGERVIVALPGVMDLTAFVRPWCAIGYDNHHESFRDVDQEALRSWPHADLSENGYAQAVKEWFEQAIEAGDIAPGASVAIVGHSFGSDTAFDLAASPEFNGDLVDVEIVLGAGYDNEAFFDSIPESTRVLSLRNRKDIPARVEEAGRGILGNAWDFVKTAIHAPHEALAEAAGVTAKTGVELFVDFPPTVIRATDNITDVTFAGGWSGAGHDPSHYRDYLESPEADNRLQDFWTAMAAAGFVGGGAVLAVDVSRPAKDRGKTGAPASVGGKRGSPTPTDDATDKEQADNEEAD